MSWLLDNGCTTQAQMYKYFFSENSHFLEEGRTLLVSESGKNYGTYFSILQENIKSRWRNKAISYKGNTIDAEVDIIALPVEGTTALVAEVKREKEQYRHDLFMLKVAYLQQTELKEYKVKTKLYTLNIRLSVFRQTVIQYTGCRFSCMYARIYMCANEVKIGSKNV